MTLRRREKLLKVHHPQTISHYTVNEHRRLLYHVGREVLRSGQALMSWIWHDDGMQVTDEVGEDEWEEDEGN